MRPGLWAFWGTLAAALVLAALRIASWDDVGSPLQVAMQAWFPVPFVLGALATFPRVRASAAWLVPAAAFAAGLLALPYVWTLHGAPKGEENCSARGFLPEAFGQAFEPVVTAFVAVAAILLLAGALMLLRAPLRPVAAWTLLAGLALAVASFAAPVCMGT